MEYATLGNTGLLVSKLCLGTATFGDGRGVFKAFGAVGQAEAEALIKTSINKGVNFVDTADSYCDGESEKILGQSLKNLGIRRQEVVIATKVYGRVGPGRNDVGASRGHILDGVEASLSRLQTDHIDLYQIHANDSLTPVEEILGALDSLVRQEKCVTSAVPTGRHGRSPRPLEFPSPKGFAGSTRCNATIRSRAGIWSGRLSLSSNPKS